MKQEYLILFILCYSFVIINSDDKVVSRYEEGIKQQIQSSLKYESPKNAYEYRPTEEKNVKEFGTYDFIVIGAGASGSVIANRLSEIKNWNVLLLEAGNFTDYLQDIPNMRLSFQLSNHNWGYTSIPQTTACLDMVDKKCPYPRGKGIGGTTLINGLVYARGNKRDFDRWADEGNPGWSYDEVLPYFKKSENFVKNNLDAPVDVKYHQTGGEFNVEYHVPIHPISKLWLEANKEKGYKIVDYNGKEQIGAAEAQLNTKHGRRVHAGNAFINPIKKRNNLKISTNSYVTKIIISKDKKTAAGVQFSHQGQLYLAKISKEVILSAGALISPQLLMLSGVGPAKHLNEVGIRVIENLEVGSTLRDHSTFYGLYFDSNLTKTHKPLKEDIKDYLQGYGYLAVPDYNENVGFYQSKYEKTPDYPDLEMMLLPVDGFFDTLQKTLSSAREKSWQHLDTTRSFALYVVALHTKSYGTIRLKSKNSFDYPLIDSRFISDPENVDIDTLYEGIQLALNLISSEAFQRINATLAKQDLPDCEDKPYLSKEYWYCALRYFTYNLYHPVGTCPMGLDRAKGAVVDSEARVHGIKKLRVADASIFPFTLAGHPYPPCVMIGEKVSDLIKKHHL